MMELIILIISSILIFSGVPSTAEELRFMSRETDSDHSEDSVQTAWSAFKVEHGKSYSSSNEDQRRRLIFEESLKIVQSHNYLYETGRSTFEMGINQFSDMEFSEIMEMIGSGYVESKASSTDVAEEMSALRHNAVPEAIDWRGDRVTGVKNQGKGCGSCWAFSATGSLEGQWMKKKRKLVSLSEQDLVDCSWAQGNFGCGGGSAQKAFDYIKKEGITTEECYPYEAKNTTCRHRRKPASCLVVTAQDVQGVHNLQKGNEVELTNAIANIGPISVVIRIAPSFIRYKTGNYQDFNCSNAYQSHAVLVVGYGANKDGGDYYIVKNSWGVTWGDKGYGHIKRNQGNMCGIADDASYPIV